MLPVSDGFVIGSCVRHIPLAGSDITKFVQQHLRDRGEKLPSQDALEIAQKVKVVICLADWFLGEVRVCVQRHCEGI